MVRLVSAIAVASTTLRRPGGRRRDRAVLVGRRQVTIEGRHVDIGAKTAEPLLDPADLTDAGQEDQRTTAFTGQRATHGARHRVLDAAGGVALEIARLDREHAAGRFNNRCVSQALRHRAGIERGRHGDDPQVLAQRALRFAHQGEGEVAFQATLVQLVEDHAADGFE